MSLNRYTYVGGNVINRADPSGMIYENPGLWSACLGSTSTPEPCRQVHVNCTLPDPLPAEGGVRVRPFPAEALGLGTIDVIYHYPSGTQLCAFETRGVWTRVSHYGEYNGLTFWVRNADHDGNRLLIDGPTPTNLCGGATPVAPSPAPSATSTVTGTPPITPTPYPYDAFNIIACVLYYESGNDTAQALDIANVIRNRMLATGGQAINQVKAVDAFQAYKDKCQSAQRGTGFSIGFDIQDYADYLVKGGAKLPPPSDERIYSALFTFGIYAGAGLANKTGADLDAALRAKGTNAQNLTARNCNNIAGNFIGHTGTNSGGYFTVFFGSDPNCHS